MRKWIARLAVVVALGIGLWGVSDILSIFALDVQPVSQEARQNLLTIGIAKLVVSVIMATLAIKRG